MWSIVEYYSAIRKDEYLTIALTWMELEEIMLSEISQTEKDNYHMVSLICGTLGIEHRKGKGRKTEWEEIREGDKP